MPYHSTECKQIFSNVLLDISTDGGCARGIEYLTLKIKAAKMCTILTRLIKKK
jgi:hypothetical protein